MATPPRATLALIRLANAAAQLPYGSGKTKGEASQHHTTLPPPLRDLESVICYILTQDEKRPTSITGTNTRCIHDTTLAGLSRDVNSCFKTL